MDPQHEPEGATRQEDRWWLRPGTETCDVCLASVQYEAVYHCRHCDAPLCLSCSVTIVERRIVVCAGCAEEDEG